MSVFDPWRRGYNAVMGCIMDGVDVPPNPYPDDSSDAALWDMGCAAAWEDGCREIGA